MFNHNRQYPAQAEEIWDIYFLAARFCAILREMGLCHFTHLTNESFSTADIEDMLSKIDGVLV